VHAVGEIKGKSNQDYQYGEGKSESYDRSDSPSNVIDLQNDAPRKPWIQENPEKRID
jgi:hypothetical protein